MALKIVVAPGQAGMSLAATLERQSDGYFWNNSGNNGGPAWQASPSYSDKAIALTADSFQVYAGENAGALGDAGFVTVRVHDQANANQALPGGSAEVYVKGGTEATPFAGGAVDSVTGNVGGNVVGDVNGKVLGGGSSTITGTGARAVDGSGNALATHTDVTSITSNTALARPVVPDQLLIPASGSEAFGVNINLYTLKGDMETPDAAPTVAVANTAGTSRNDHLSATTMTLVSTGIYKVTYTTQSTDVSEGLVFTFSVTVGSVTRTYTEQAVTSNTFATDFTSSDRTTLGNINTKIGSPAGASVSADVAAVKTDTAAVKVQTDKIGTNSGDSANAATAQTTISTNLNATVSSRSTLGGTAQTGDAFARLGAPAGASLAADMAAVKASVGDVYLARIDFHVDDVGGTDGYTVSFAKNGVPVTSGVSNVLLTVTRRGAPGTVLISSTAMLAIGSTASYYHDESTNRVGAGNVVIVDLAATIDGHNLTMRTVLGRDKTS